MCCIIDQEFSLCSCIVTALFPSKLDLYLTMPMNMIKAKSTLGKSNLSRMFSNSSPSLNNLSSSEDQKQRLQDEKIGKVSLADLPDSVQLDEMFETLMVCDQILCPSELLLG